MNDKRRMNVAAALNSKYTRYTYVMLTSLLENQPENMDIHIYLLQNDLTEDDKACLAGMVQARKGTLHWLDMQKETFHEFCKISETWSQESFFRLILQDVLPGEVDRILYLDVDVIVNQSLEEMYFADFEGKLLCACPEPFMGAFCDMRDEIFKEHLPQGLIYFNSGVLLLNISLMRQKYCLQDYLEVVRRLDYKLWMPDQDLLNYVHWKETKYIELSRYNLIARLAYNCDVHYEQVKREAVIVHFTGKKPWNGKSVHFDIERLWWDYARKTPFYSRFIEEFMKDKGEMRMKTGVQYQSALWQGNTPRNICENGFVWTELPYEKIEEYEAWQQTIAEGADMPVVAGIIVQGKELDEDTLFTAIMKAEELGASYVLLNTEGLTLSETVSEVIENCSELIREKKIEIYLENGFVHSEKSGYQNCFFSQVKELKRLAEMFDRICDRECFGISLNIGNANLLGKNLRIMVEDAGKKLKHLHINDNDGFHNEHQLPFTYTKGRGDRSTDWYRLVGALTRSKYQGWLMFDVTGTFDRAPVQLHNSILALLGSITNEWEEMLKFEDYISEPGKKLILFGTGVMAFSYMEAWGQKYRPAFFVDNNSAIWNTERFGVEVKAPAAILEIPENERNVWICTKFYEQIGTQLAGMGIQYRCYDDHYDI